MDLLPTRWAQAALKLPNLAFLVLDTTGIKQDSDILRILLIDQHFNSLLHLLVHPTRQIGDANTQWTGIQSDELADLPTLQRVWPDVLAALGDRYIVSYGLKFVQERLDENAKAHGLRPIWLIGEDLNKMATGYFGSYAIKLTDACMRVGYILPTPPMAVERAQGLVRLMHAMAVGIAPDDDEQPF